MSPFRHSTHVSSKSYAEYTLPHPLLRTRSPFALPARDYTPSTERAAQVYTARAVTYDVDGSHTGPLFATHNKGWGIPCRLRVRTSAPQPPLGDSSEGSSLWRRDPWLPAWLLSRDRPAGLHTTSVCPSPSRKISLHLASAGSAPGSANGRRHSRRT